ncbi:hypothetical protein HanIR_Chr15g0738761 [Helianthus annuus]|nr:hypothetical protein HanIR_Chr15g0738761 [Helianthus annuus]
MPHTTTAPMEVEIQGEDGISGTQAPAPVDVAAPTPPQELNVGDKPDVQTKVLQPVGLNVDVSRIMCGKTMVN